MGNAAVAVPAAVPTTKALTVDPPEPAPGSTGAERFATHAVFKKNNAVRPLIFGYNGAPPYQRGRAVESSNRGIQQGLDGIVVEAMFSLENSQDIVIASEYRDLVPGENDLDVITTKARLEKAINPQDERMKDVFLEDFLTVFKERTIVVIELKAHGQRKEELSRRVAEIIDRCQAIDSVVIASADSTILNAMRRHSPDAILAVTYRKTHKLFEGRKAGYPEPSGAKQNVHPFRSEYYRAVRGDIEARKLDINAVDIDASVLDKNCIPEFRDEKVVVGVRLMMDERGRKADRDVLEALYPSVAFVVSRDPVVALQWRAELLTERIRRNVGLPGQGRYTIRVKTGYLPQGGTDAQPYLRLTGLRGHGKIVRLGHRHHACFQTGRSDVFALEEEDLGPLQYLTLRLRGESPSERGWYLEYIEIHDRGGLGATKPEVYIFPYMDWVKCVTTSNVEGGDPTAGLVRIERPLLFGRSLAGPIEKLKADIKTGDIILYSGGSIADEAAKLRSGSKFTHAGIVIRDGADNRILVYEETLNYRESEIRDAFSDEYWDGVHAYDLFVRTPTPPCLHIAPHKLYPAAKDPWLLRLRLLATPQGPPESRRAVPPAWLRRVLLREAAGFGRDNTPGRARARAAAGQGRSRIPRQNGGPVRLERAGGGWSGTGRPPALARPRAHGLQRAGQGAAAHRVAHVLPPPRRGQRSDRGHPPLLLHRGPEPYPIRRVQAPVGPPRLHDQGRPPQAVVRRHGGRPEARGLLRAPQRPPPPRRRPPKDCGGPGRGDGADGRGVRQRDRGEAVPPGRAPEGPLQEPRGGSPAVPVAEPLLLRGHRGAAAEDGNPLRAGSGEEAGPGRFLQVRRGRPSRARDDRQNFPEDLIEGHTLEL